MPFNSSTRSNNMTNQNHDLAMNPYALLKRILDIFLTVIFAPIIATICVIFAVLIKLDSKGPAVYTQNRMGLDGKEFKIYKLRSMHCNAEQQSGSVWAQKDDPRVTKVGSFIRKTRIDELPQFLNIIKGEMSLIGPRPERPDLTEKFSQDIPNFKNRLAIRPGITGWAQVNGGYEHTPEEKLQYDLKYIQNYSLSMDIKILWKTVLVVLTGHGAR